MQLPIFQADLSSDCYGILKLLYIYIYICVEKPSKRIAGRLKHLNTLYQVIINCFLTAILRYSLLPVIHVYLLAFLSWPKKSANDYNNPENSNVSCPRQEVWETWYLASWWWIFGHVYMYMPPRQIHRVWLLLLLLIRDTASDITVLVSGFNGLSFRSPENQIAMYGVYDRTFHTSRASIHRSNNFLYGRNVDWRIFSGFKIEEWSVGLPAKRDIFQWN